MSHKILDHIFLGKIRQISCMSSVQLIIGFIIILSVKSLGWSGGVCHISCIIGASN